MVWKKFDVVGEERSSLASSRKPLTEILSGIFVKAVNRRKNSPSLANKFGGSSGTLDWASARLPQTSSCKGVAPTVRPEEESARTLLFWKAETKRASQSVLANFVPHGPGYVSNKKTTVMLAELWHTSSISPDSVRLRFTRFETGLTKNTLSDLSDR